MTEPTVRINYLRTLKAIREFLPEPIPSDVLASILDVVRWTGSAENKQPWQLIVLEDRTDLEAVAAMASYTKHVAKAGAAIAITLAGLPQGHLDYDDGRLGERIMLAAHAYGLGSCIGWYNTPDEQTHIKQYLSVPADRYLRTIISLGVIDQTARAERPHRTGVRKALNEIVSWGRYGIR